MIHFKHIIIKSLQNKNIQRGNSSSKFFIDSFILLTIVSSLFAVDFKSIAFEKLIDKL